MWDLYSNLFFFFVKDIYWFTYAIKSFFFFQRKQLNFLSSVLCMFALVESIYLLLVGSFPSAQVPGNICFSKAHLFLSTCHSCMTWSYRRISLTFPKLSLLENNLKPVITRQTKWRIHRNGFFSQTQWWPLLSAKSLPPAVIYLDPKLLTWKRQPLGC